MTELYEKAVNAVHEAKDQELLDFVARRLVEMAGHIIMGYLLIIDATRDDMFRKSAFIYLNYGEAEVKKHAEFISTFNRDNIDLYK